MTTQAIAGPANFLTPVAPASGNQATFPDAAEMPFNQVLQREVTERRSADQSSRSELRQSDAAASEPAAPAQASSEAEKAQKEAVKDAEESDSSESDRQLSDAAGASAELLALVANMTKLVSAAAGAHAGSGEPKAQADVQIHVDGTAISGNPGASDIETLQGSAGADKKDAGAAFAQEFAQAAKNLKGEPTTDRMQSVSAQSVPARVDAATALSAAAVPAEQIASTVDAASTPQALMPMQHALNKVHMASTAQATESLAPPVGTPAWDQAVGQKVAWMVAGAQQSASLTLNPPDLGPLQVVLNVNNAQANATFIAAQPEVRQALEAALPKLREMLGDAGIQLGQANINAGTPHQGGNFEQGSKPSSSHFGHEQHGEQPVVPVRQTAMRQGLGMVDTFA
ncbi:flagellar hook-length control protein FliK [Oxalobacteraceae bacterium R-40]|uniref:Flagellar hook-length control protein FliK n=1 Tax=Keguizhuia sedimenti TaxID=3064264 RepID=A0ABU1BP80_9BURK|nr:flagellar hook-length control protein FliK [Oxalobacteraceae bacterium R-40]